MVITNLNIPLLSEKETIEAVELDVARQKYSKDSDPASAAGSEGSENGSGYYPKIDLLAREPRLYPHVFYKYWGQLKGPQPCVGKGDIHMSTSVCLYRHLV